MSLARGAGAMVEALSLLRSSIVVLVTVSATTAFQVGSISADRHCYSASFSL